MGECSEGLPGDMPGILAPGEGPETCGEPGHWPLWLGDTMGYGELGSRGPGGQERLSSATQKDPTCNHSQSQVDVHLCALMSAT